MGTSRANNAFSSLIQGRDSDFPIYSEIDFVTFSTVIFLVLITTLLMIRDRYNFNCHFQKLARLNGVMYKMKAKQKF